MYIHKKQTEKIDISKIDQLKVWQYILGLNVELNQRFITSLRVDHNPDCKLKESNGYIYYYDKPGRYLHGKNCFNAWMEINNVTYGVALNQISKKVFNNILPTEIKPHKKVENKKSEIIPEVMKWTKPALNWWKSFGITPNENILNLSGMIHNGSNVAFTKLTFCYVYNRDIDNNLLPLENWCYKIYSPKCICNGVEYKSDWLGNVKSNMTWFTDNRQYHIGESKPKLFFCKSAKCQLVLESLLKTEFSYLHPQSEATLNKYPHIELLKNFDVNIMLDNDETGVLMSQKFSELLTKNGIENKQFFCTEFKDISDTRKAWGESKTLAFLRSLGI